MERSTTKSCIGVCQITSSELIVIVISIWENSFPVARDAVGISALFIGWRFDGERLRQKTSEEKIWAAMKNFILLALPPFVLDTGSVWISSERLHNGCEHFEVFPPGHLYSSKNGGLRRWYNPACFFEAIPSTAYDPLAPRHAFENVDD